LVKPDAGMNKIDTAVPEEEKEEQREV